MWQRRCNAGALGGYDVVLIEHPLYFAVDRVPAGARFVLADVGDAENVAAWRGALRGAHAVVHFSAVNPYPNATWDESAQHAAASVGARTAGLLLDTRKIADDGAPIIPT